MEFFEKPVVDVFQSSATRCDKISLRSALQSYSESYHPLALCIHQCLDYHPAAGERVGNETEIFIQFFIRFSLIRFGLVIKIGN